MVQSYAAIYGEEPSRTLVFGRSDVVPDAHGEASLEESWWGIEELVLETHDGSPWHSYAHEITCAEFLDTICPRSTAFWFQGFTQLKRIRLDLLDTSRVTSMRGMFWLCESLNSLDLSNFNTSAVRDMSFMFVFCRNIKQIDVSSFDTSNVLGMQLMFRGCHRLKNLNLSHFETSKVEDMREMFEECEELFLKGISDWDVSSEVDTRRMFANCPESNIPAWFIEEKRL